MRSRLLAAGLLCLGVLGCSSDKATAPTPTYPNVAGNYAGTATFVATTTTVSCAANTAVSQAGNRVNIAAIQLGPECGISNVPGQQFNISTTGALEITPTTVTDSGCEGTYAVNGSGGFFDRELRITLNYSSSAPRCILRSFTTTMSR